LRRRALRLGRRRRNQAKDRCCRQRCIELPSIHTHLRNLVRDMVYSASSAA
jgi:hypothetical protein